MPLSVTEFGVPQPVCSEDCQVRLLMWGVDDGVVCSGAVPGEVIAQAMCFPCAECGKAIPGAACPRCGGAGCPGQFADSRLGRAFIRMWRERTGSEPDREAVELAEDCVTDDPDMRGVQLTSLVASVLTETYSHNP